MGKKFFQSFLNRFKTSVIFIALSFLFLPAIVLAQDITSVTGVGITPANPSPGNVVTVNWSYSMVPASNNPSYFIVVSNTAAIEPAGTAGQSIVADCGSLTQVSGGCNIGGNVPVGTDTYSTSITIPSGLAPGTWYVTVVMRDYNIYLNPNLVSGTVMGNTTFTVPLPATSCTLTDTVGSATAGPGGLILYTLNYSFVNTTSFTLSSAIPANTTVSTLSPGGSLGAGTVTWTPYSGAAANTITGTAWMLLSVNTGVPNGTVITDSATGTTSSTTCNSSALVTIQNPTLSLTKSESANTAVAGGPITYTLGWLASGSSLQFYDSYDNDTGDTNSAIMGYDNVTPYYLNAAVDGDLGNWNVVTTPQGNNYVIGNVLDNSGHNANGNNDFPELLRNAPGVNICGGFTVQGDLQIPVTAWGAAGGGDIDMVVAMNPSLGITVTAGLSIDNNPNYFFFQKNQNFNGSIYPTPLGTNCLFGTCWPGSTSPVTAGSWYTINVNVEFSGSGPITYIANVWPTGNPSADGTPITWIDANTAAADNSIFPIPASAPGGVISGCSCGWYQGWQTAGTAGTNYFSNLQVYSGGPVSDYIITDPIPSGVTYVGSTEIPTGLPSGPLVWNNPGLVTAECPVTWWGTVACPGPISNQFTMSANNIALATSNTVNLTLSSCITSTPTPTNTMTNTPTNSPTPTVTNTPTLTSTSTPTNSPTMTPTNTATNTPLNTNTPTNTTTNTPSATATNTPLPTNTPTITPTFTFSPTPVPPLAVWPNPFNPKYAVGGVLKAGPFQISSATMEIYTVSGEMITKPLAESGNFIYWDGTNMNYTPASTGIYIYVIKNGSTVMLSGKILLVRN